VYIWPSLKPGIRWVFFIYRFECLCATPVCGSRNGNRSFLSTRNRVLKFALISINSLYAESFRSFSMPFELKLISGCVGEIFMTPFWDIFQCERVKYKIIFLFSILLKTIKSYQFLHWRKLAVPKGKKSVWKFHIRCTLDVWFENLKNTRKI
jgi:hypothetical protein